MTVWPLDPGGSQAKPIGADALPYFLAGTPIAVPGGSCLVEDLRPGDLVLTFEGEARRLLWAVSRRLGPAQDGHRAATGGIYVPAGTLGADRDLWLSPWHRVLCLDRVGRQVLVAVRHLCGLGGIAVAVPAVPERPSVQLIFARHEVLLAQGVACESTYLGSRGAALLPEAERRNIEVWWPGLRLAHSPARRFLDRLGPVVRQVDGNLAVPWRCHAPRHLRQDGSPSGASAGCGGRPAM